jgi:hypothetical protein
MRVRATIEFDVRFDEEKFFSIEELVYYYKQYFGAYMNAESSLKQEIRDLLEAEEHGLAEYGSVAIPSLVIIDDETE